MLTYFIPLVSSMSPLWDYCLNYVICVAFIATVPIILRKLVGVYV